MRSNDGSLFAGRRTIRIGPVSFGFEVGLTAENNPARMLESLDEAGVFPL